MAARMGSKEVAMDIKKLVDIDDSASMIRSPVVDESEESLRDWARIEYSIAGHTVNTPLQLAEPYLVFEVGQHVSSPLLVPYESVPSTSEHDYAMVTKTDRERIKKAYPKPSQARIPVIGEELDVL